MVGHCAMKLSTSLECMNNTYTHTSSWAILSHNETESLRYRASFVGSLTNASCGQSPKYFEMPSAVGKLKQTKNDSKKEDLRGHKSGCLRGGMRCLRGRSFASRRKESELHVSKRYFWVLACSGSSAPARFRFASVLAQRRGDHPKKK